MLVSGVPDDREMSGMENERTVRTNAATGVDPDGSVRMSFRARGRWGAFAILVLLISGIGHGASAEENQEAKGRTVVRIAASFEPGAIVVSLADRRLYHVRSKGRAISYPIATPRDKDMWTGVELISSKRKLPSWRPTPTMLRENPRLPSYVPGGHKFNPMGARALYLGNTLYRIHGTDAPWLIGENVSKGCIRMHDAHVIELFDNTKIGARVVVIEPSLKASSISRSTS